MSTSPLDGGNLPGQQFDEALNIVKEFTQQMDSSPPTVGSLLGTDAIEITPNDGGSAQTRTWDVDQINAAYASLVIAYAELVSVQLPDTLTAASIIFNSAQGDGSNSQTMAGSSEGSYASLSGSLNSSAQGSASIIPVLQYTVVPTPKVNIHAMVYVFFLPDNMTIDNICTVLSGSGFANATVESIPLFFEQIITFSLTGQSVNLSANGSVQQSVQISASNITHTLGSGAGYSYQFSLDGKTVQIGPFINAEITLSSATDTAMASAAAAAVFTSGTNWDAETGGDSVGPVSVTGSVYPSTIPATTPSSIPVTGKYLVKLDTSPFSGFGNNMLRATVVDFSQFASLYG